MPRRAVILGLGTFGGGLGAAKHLARLGDEVLIADLLSEEDLAEPLAELKPELDDGSITLHLESNDPADAA
ncbi:MAG: hypothetical protein AAFO89_12385, partial [Planctomycetota bacterium]